MILQYNVHDVLLVFLLYSPSKYFTVYFMARVYWGIPDNKNFLNNVRNCVLDKKYVDLTFTTLFLCY